MLVVRQTVAPVRRQLRGLSRSRGQGRSGFPNLTTASWLWGGTPEAIAETIRVGINSPHPDSRKSQMLAFGRDGLLQRGEIENVVAYVRTLSTARCTAEHRGR
jgi:cbb3-type cytochrome c oxidase subunit III